MPGPLEGLKVIEFCQMYAGPGTAAYLADMGAEVIRIEPPDGGRDHAGGQVEDTFLVLNRGKRTIALDIRTPEGREVVERLIRQSDVMIVAWRHGHAERLGYGYEQVREINPRLVYASITGWGTRGPLVGGLGYDLLMQAHTGMMAHRPGPDGSPLEASFFPADQAIPMLLGYGIMLALWARERTGLGQKVETSQLQAMIAIQSIYLVQHDRAPKNLEAPPWRPPHCYRASDGRYVMVVLITQLEWSRFWECLGVASEVDERFATGEGRQTNILALHAWLETLFARQSSEAWVQQLTQAGLACARVQSRAEFLADPHAWENEMLVEREDPEFGTIKMMGLPFRLSSTPGLAGGAIPRLGQDSQAILQELGYSESAIAAMRASGTVH